jgi:hypothetical protein
MARPTQTDDGSLVFSLKELERIEQERIRAEQSAKDARKRAAERARAEDEAARRKQAEELRAVAERARREEAARETAMALAEMGRVRAEVEARAHAERDQAKRAHEIELAERRAAILRGRRRWLTGASVLITFASASFAALLSRELGRAEAELRERSRAFARERDARVRSAQDLATANARLGELTLRLALDTESRAPPSPSSAPKSPGHRFPSKKRPRLPAAHDCNGADGDPLNGCLR